MSFSFLSSPDSFDKYNAEINEMCLDFGSQSEGFDAYINCTDAITDTIFDDMKDEDPPYSDNIPIDLEELLKNTYSSTGFNFNTDYPRSNKSTAMPPKSAPQNSNRVEKERSRTRSKSHAMALLNPLFLENSDKDSLDFYLEGMRSLKTPESQDEKEKSLPVKRVNQRSLSTSYPFVRSSRHRPKSSRNTPVRRDINYNEIEVPYIVEEAEFLANKARNPIPESFNHYHNSKLVQSLPDEENEVCTIKRTRHIRTSVSLLQNLHKDIKYDENEAFDSKSPYEPQYIRSFIDLELDLPFNETRAGLCPYCPTLKFYELRTSAYAQHLALQHGILTNNYIVPNPFSYGLYKIKKNVSPDRKTIAKELVRYGVICPCCYQVVQVLHTRSKENTLGHYLRHFKVLHSKFSSDIYSYFDRFEC